jgi:hypothetical protein
VRVFATIFRELESSQAGLITMKKLASRAKDLEDIAALEVIARKRAK